jgi:DNA-binding HxlR family transcriptional regulator
VTPTAGVAGVVAAALRVAEREAERRVTHPTPSDVTAGRGKAGPPAGAPRGLRASTSNARSRSPVEITVGLLRGRWTALILWNLFWGGKRFYRLLRDLQGIARKALADELQEMERIGLIERRFHRGELDGVEYTLSRVGESLKPLLATMYQWGLLVRNHPVADGLTVWERPGPQAELPRTAGNAARADAAGRAAPSDAGEGRLAAPAPRPIAG